MSGSWREKMVPLPGHRKPLESRLGNPHALHRGRAIFTPAFREPWCPPGPSPISPPVSLSYSLAQPLSLADVKRAVTSGLPYGNPSARVNTLLGEDNGGGRGCVQPSEFANEQTCLSPTVFRDPQGGQPAVALQQLRCAVSQGACGVVSGANEAIWSRSWLSLLILSP